MKEESIVNGRVRIQYQIRKGRGIPLIFLHGGMGSSCIWKLMEPDFIDMTSSIVFPDLRGHGLSDRPLSKDDYLLEKHVDDINKIIDHHRFKEVILIGHCLGAMVTATYVYYYPEKIRKLVLINPGCGVPWYISNKIIKNILSFICRKIIGANIIKSQKKRVDYFRFINTFDFNPKRIWADLKIMGTSSLANQFMALMEWDGTNYLKKINKPTLIIAGTKDLIFPPGETEKVWSLVPHAKLVYLKTNHVSVLNNTREVFAVLKAFIST
ncbi:hypothetical protein A2Y99_04220 [Candidatus Gottesmanbacteria bacterium RBG_13_37_7]|uniref:AB hydrolase-1 domain-containing protein n=1 Tax=Candidatus Gottesmanbacteria bacterium RBG_13_37_7 TaxID=1798369 RepID=A0A1F5YK43_9BACT|nr:MAG: hypothetical protein A2Y99_04220 [Candidatus Gottesmanbacteria bacterium RBG_13_37_7]